MEYTNLGRTALRVSRLCLGTMHFGPNTDEAGSHAIMDRARDLGIDFFDTADTYGRRRGEGVTERIIGNWFAADPSRRDRVVLATKVYGVMGDGVNDRGLSARHIVAGCEASLRRLRTDRIDLYQMHHVDRSAPWAEVWQAMDMLVAQGKVLYVGSSNFAGWHIAAAQEAADRRNSLGLVSEQCIYNLLNRRVESEVLPAAEHYGLGVLPWSPLAGGALSGALAKRESGTTGRTGSPGTLKTIDVHRHQLQSWEDFCRRRGQAPGELATAWLLAQPTVTAPIIGPRTVAQLDGIRRSLDIRIDDETARRLDEIFPPVGVGPEAWAW
ncbi:NDP-hexose 2,3-enoyl reductase [Stackebrandtia albiflava]|uniref:NDP-hexose 2,3-enoyl reductase n=1 Tax=Stackebrandtia albiflava TaxID=406432 RepID=A0A562UQF4_9ACTN|nr:aldo/keto reductase [Stackebrandtia albiflava]TWJ07849.1 NDP-hexose 2,3-enoyl reductase [Stackebrandtia albiflava]